MAERWQQWMPFHIDKFRGSQEVQAMHPAARLGYIYLLASAWQSSDCSVSGDALDLATESGLGDEMWAIYGTRIMRKFRVRDDGRMTNDVLQAEWDSARKKFEQTTQARSEAGRIGNAKRWGRNCDNNDRKRIAKESQNIATGTGTGTEEKKELAAVVDGSFSYFCTLLKKDPKRYTLTKVRREKAVMRIGERMKANEGDLHAVKREIVTCIRNLAASDFHRTNGHTDWTEQIFRSADEFEKRLNWTAPQPQHVEPRRIIYTDPEEFHA